MSTLQVENLSNGIDSVPIDDTVYGTSRAWATINGALATPVITRGYGFSSITDVGAGAIDLNLSTPFADELYTTVASGSNFHNIAFPNTNAVVSVRTYNAAHNLEDTAVIAAAVFNN